MRQIPSKLTLKQSISFSTSAAHKLSKNFMAPIKMTHCNFRKNLNKRPGPRGTLQIKIGSVRDSQVSNRPRPIFAPLSDAFVALFAYYEVSSDRDFPRFTLGAEPHLGANPLANPWRRQ